MKSIGEKIKEQREILEMTQIDLSEETGITVRSISKYETGVVSPRGVNLRKIASALQVSERYLSDPDIDDPSYAPYVDAVRGKYGKKGATEMEKLLERNRALFAGGDIPQEDKDLFFNAIMQAYVETKQEAHDRFTPKKYKE